jgi:hypothetical protein
MKIQEILSQIFDPGRNAWSASILSGTAGKSVTIDNLPPNNIKRWTFLPKSQVVLAVRRGLISRKHACERYCISSEEFLSWDRTINKHDLRGSQTTPDPDRLTDPDPDRLTDPDPDRLTDRERAEARWLPECETLTLAATGAAKVLGPDHRATRAFAKAAASMDKADLWWARHAMKNLRKDQREAIAAPVEE